MKYLILLLLFPALLSAQVRLRPLSDPTIARKPDVQAAILYAQGIEARRANDSIYLLNKSIADSIQNKKKFDSIKADVAGRVRIDSAIAANLKLQQQIKTGDSLITVQFKNDSIAKRIRNDSIVNALSGKQTVLGFTPYNATNPSGFLTASTAAATYQTQLGFTPYNSSNPAGYITNSALSGYLTSANAASTYQTALGFTPYNATNPSGFITSSALAGYITSSTAAATYYPATNPNNYITNSALSGYLTSASAASTYQTALGFTPATTTSVASVLDSVSRVNQHLRDSLSVLRTMITSTKLPINLSGSVVGIALQTDYTVTHNLGFVPAAVFISNTGTTPPLGYTISSMTSTSFSVKFSAVPLLSANTFNYLIIKP